ncbi:hypothetical protein GF338_09965 [candidate division WOR-3 bacterium]|nr:hypothetical protein [candidate division WOR-3 bacterium]
MNVGMILEKPNIVFVTLNGVLEESHVDEMYDEMEKSVKKVGTINLLADMSGLTSIPPKTRKKIKNRGKAFTDYKHIALFGAKPAVRVLGGLLLKMLPMGKGETRFFKTETEARTWLTESSKEE